MGMMGDDLALILLVDDHPLFRDGFAQMARVLRPHWTLAYAASAAEALSILSQIAPDLAIIDIGLPGDDGFILLKAIAERAPAMPQVLISGRNDAAVRVRAQACGARAYIVKTMAPETIVSLLDAVINGSIRFGTDEPIGDVPTLTRRQAEILDLLAEGHGNKEIRHRLGIAERTVRAHLTELFQLLGAHSRTQALIRAREVGLI